MILGRGRGSGSVKSDAEGRFIFNALHDPVVSLVAKKSGWGPGRANRVEWGSDDVVITMRPGVTIAGKVTDAEGRGVPGANVVADPRRVNEILHEEGYLQEPGTADTGSDGSYRIVDLEPGEYIIRVDTEEGVAEPVYVTAPGWGETYSAGDLQFQSGLHIRGRFTDRKTGEPVALVQVRLYTMDGRFVRNSKVRTGKDGAYDIGKLAPGVYQLGFAAPWPYFETQGVQGEMQQIDVRDGDAGNVDFSLEEGGAISGRVTDSNGKPVSNASVWLIIPGDDTRGYPHKGVQITTDERGEFSAGGVPPGSDWRVAACTNGYALGWSEPFQVALDEAVEDVCVTLGQGGVIAGTVRDDDGRPRAGVRVQASTWKRGDALDREYQRVSSLETETAKDGTYKIEKVSTGIVQMALFEPVTVERAGTLQANRPFRRLDVYVTEGETLTVDF